jgi:hypothetical protein
LKRQEVLISAWAEFNKSNPPAEQPQFTEAWMKARNAALAKAQLPNEFASGS